MTDRQALARHPVAILGAILATASAVVFITLVIAMLAGMLNNPYAGLVVFIAIPAVFVMGLILIPIGMSLQRRALRKNPNAVAEWPVIDLRRPDVRRTVIGVVALTAVNVIIVLLAGYGGLHAMESASFCGQVCHTTMEPQFVAWQQATHAGVPCVGCHVGEGATGFVRAKLSGVRQLVHVMTDNVPQPVPPGAEMLPGAQAELCRTCHKPERASGDRVNVLRAYADDETNTETVTVLQMHVSPTRAFGRAIHWHADPAVRIEYVATDDAREMIPYVRVTNAQGQVKEYVAPDTPQDVITSGTRKVMDCMDCHNTVGHPIATSPEAGVDAAIARAMVSHELPFIRREGVRLVKEEYPSKDEGLRAIEEGLKTFYQTQTGANPQEVTRAIAGIQNVYRTNVFPSMKVTYGTYPNQKGHFTSTGCFRCHDDGHKASDGTTISSDCEYCHTDRTPVPTVP